MNPTDCDECCRLNLTTSDLGDAVVYVAIVSDLFACLGSLAIIVLYIAWKDLRRGAQSIITWLAIADLCAAISYILGDVAVLYYDEDKGHECESLCFIVCQITTYMVFCSISASFLWTAILALHFCLLAVFNNAQLAEKLMPLYHVIAWGLPVLIGLIFLSTETLAFAPFVSGVWCFISAPVKTYKYNDRDVGIKVALKVPEFIGYCIVLVLYVSSITIMCKKFQTQNRKFFSVQMRLACIPVLFILLRVWDTVQYFYYSHVVVLASSNPYGCIPTDVKRTHYAFAVLQAFEGGQGWVNAILYIFLSKDMRKKLIITLACKRKPSSRRRQSVMIPTIGVSTNKPTLPSYTYYSPPVSNEDSSVDMVQVAT